MKKLLVLLFALPLMALGQNATCIDAGFENLPVGANTSLGWSVSTGLNTSNSIICPSYPVTYNLNAAATSVSTTPIADHKCYGVASSPFSGNKVMVLNKGNYYSRTRMVQSFSVTNSNFIYRYAYKGLINNGINCDGASLIFNFYDCNNAPVPAISRTIVTNSATYNADVPYWNTGAPFYAGGILYSMLVYTPNWVLHSVNLSPYIGTCITVEVIASPNTMAGWEGYCYYDCESTDNLIEPGPGLVQSAGSFICCNPAGAVFNALAGFSSYLWQGPVGSGVSGTTASSITTSVSGTYTLTAGSGTAAISQVFTLSVASVLPFVTISASSPSACTGGTVALQALGTALTSYTWSTGANAAAVVPTITNTALYMVSATNTLGCVATSSLLVLAKPVPTLQISFTSTSVCQNAPVWLSATGQGVSSYSWNTGQTAPSITINPQASGVYEATAINNFGCTQAASVFITVWPLPPVQIVPTASAICAGQSLSLTAVSSPTNTYVWNTGATSPSLTDQPAASAQYWVQVTNANGCKNADTLNITVYNLPQVQIGVSAGTICAGEQVTLTASAINGSGGAINLCTWSGGYTGTIIAVSPSLTTGYTVTVTDLSLCMASTQKTVQVAACTGLEQLAEPTLRVQVFPNPAAGAFTVKGYKRAKGLVVNALGQSVKEFEISEANGFLAEITGVENGIYILRVDDQTSRVIVH